MTHFVVHHRENGGASLLAMLHHTIAQEQIGWRGLLQRTGLSVSLGCGISLSLGYFSPTASCGTKRVGHPYSNDQTEEILHCKIFHLYSMMADVESRPRELQ